jgi:hypothetical protein
MIFCFPDKIDYVVLAFGTVINWAYIVQFRQGIFSNYTLSPQQTFSYEEQVKFVKKKKKKKKNL